MKQSEIKKCAVCGEGVMKCGLPTFYKIKMERFIVDIGAIKRQHGLEMMLGSGQLASVMGPDEDIAKSVSEPVDIFICEQCALEEHSIAIINEVEQDKS